MSPGPPRDLILEEVLRHLRQEGELRLGRGDETGTILLRGVERIEGMRTWIANNEPSDEEADRMRQFFGYRVQGQWSDEDLRMLIAQVRRGELDDRMLFLTLRGIRD